MSTTLDPEEVAKFNKLADDWWDLNGPLRTLHHINPIRVKFIQDHCALDNVRLIDVGCGGGILSESLSRAKANVTGIDMDPAALHTAQEHAALQNLAIVYEHIAVEDMAKAHAGTFDVVTCMELLEHTPAPQLIIEACALLLKPGGKLFVSTLNRHPKAYVMAILGAEYVMNLLPKGTHDYQKFIKPAELAVFARNVGLTLEKLTGVNYNPITRQCRLTSDLKVNYMACLKRN